MLKDSSTKELLGIAADVDFILRKRSEEVKSVGFLPKHFIYLPQMRHDQKGFFEILLVIRNNAGLSLAQSYGAVLTGATIDVGNEKNKNIILSVIREFFPDCAPQE